MLLLLLFLLEGSLLMHAQPQPQAELSREDIFCIAQSREATALGRWLHCLQPASSQDPQDHELPTMDIDHKLPTMDIEREESSQIELLTSDTEDLNDKSAVDEELPQVQQLTVSQGDSTTEINLRDNGVQDKGGGNDVSVPSAMHSEVAEKSGSSKDRTEELRPTGDDTLLHWLKLNVGMLAFGKLFSSLIKRCIRKTGSRQSLEQDEVISNNMVCKVRKELRFNNASSKKSFESAHLQEIGSSLGSAVGAVFSEVLLKTANSGSPIPSDKISMLLESALRELTILVADDVVCSKLLDDFSTAFKTIYSTMYRIQQACISYEDSTGISTHFQKDDNLSKGTYEKPSASAKSNEEIVHASKTDLSDDSWQVKPGVAPHSSGNIGKGKESQSILAADALSQWNNNSVSLADNEELNSAALATSSVEIHESASDGTFGKLELISERPNIPTFVGNQDVLELTSSANHVKPADKCSTHLDYEVDDASSLYVEPPGLMPRLDALALMAQSPARDGSEFQADFLKICERYVRAQEQHNQIKFVKLRHSEKQQSLEEEKIQLTIVANGLMRENIDLDRLKANFKESRILELQARDAHVSFSTMCADELAAGLLVMLATLVYSVHKYSYALLNDLVSTCQSSAKAPRRSWGMHIDWFYNSLDSMSEKFQAFVCQVSVTGRISFGLVLVGLVASLLLRRSVTNSSQAMPATILIIVLGGVCGLIGKISVDSLGGSGNQWWAVWGAFCVMHALTNCFTPSVYRLLHGLPTGRKARFGLPFWVRRVTFHMTLVLILPVLAGVLPFGPFSLVLNDFVSAVAKTLSSGIWAVYQWPAQFF